MVKPLLLKILIQEITENTENRKIRIMKILDATAGFRGIWFEKNHPLVTFLDKRSGKYYYMTKSGKKKCTTIKPDVVCEWKDIAYPDDYFDMIVFDPPHIFRKDITNGNMIIDYGKLNPNSWRRDLEIAFKQLFRILKPNGVFILKWNECNKSIDDIPNIWIKCNFIFISICDYGLVCTGSAN